VSSRTWQLLAAAVSIALMVGTASATTWGTKPDRF
jgi:hypothetical protein